MGLTCSVLGHRYGERERIEERDRKGTEEVVSVRDVKRCDRCDHLLVVSESKDITVAEDAIAPASKEEPPAEESDPSLTDYESPPEIDSSPVTDDAEILANEPVDRDPGEWPPVDTQVIEPGSTAPDWPPVDEPHTESEEQSADIEWPEVDDAEDEGFDAVVGEDSEADDIIIEAVSGTHTASEPVESVDEGGFKRAGPIDHPADPSETALHTEYFCPQCSWTAESLTASIRRGDICPECRRGYIAERER